MSGYRYDELGRCYLHDARRRKRERSMIAIFSASCARSSIRLGTRETPRREPHLAISIGVDAARILDSRPQSITFSRGHLEQEPLRHP
jgi:hypothetical protein